MLLWVLSWPAFAGSYKLVAGGGDWDVYGDAAAMADIDEDGRDDILLATYDSGSTFVEVRGFTPGAGFSEAIRTDLGPTTVVRSFSAHDVNNDGHIDVLVATDLLLLLLGDGTGAFELQETIDDRSGPMGTGDVDG